MSSKWCSLPLNDKKIGTVYCQWITMLEWFTSSIIQRHFIIKWYKPQTYCVNELRGPLIQVALACRYMIIDIFACENSFPSSYCIRRIFRQQTSTDVQTNQSIEKTHTTFITQTVCEDIKRVHITQFEISLFSNDILNSHKIQILIMYLKFGNSIRSYFDQW